MHRDRHETCRKGWEGGTARHDQRNISKYVGGSSKSSVGHVCGYRKCICALIDRNETSISRIQEAQRICSNSCCRSGDVRESHTKRRGVDHGVYKHLYVLRFNVVRAQGNCRRRRHEVEYRAVVGIEEDIFGNVRDEPCREKSTRGSWYHVQDRGHKCHVGRIVKDAQLQRTYKLWGELHQNFTDRRREA